jgi:acetyl esterase/lipase
VQLLRHRQDQTPNSRIALSGASAGGGLATALPPMLIQVGSHEILLGDAVRLAAQAAAHHVEVTLQVTPEVPHVFQAFAAILRNHFNEKT